MSQRDGPTRSVAKVFRQLRRAAAALDRDSLRTASLRDLAHDLGDAVATLAVAQHPPACIDDADLNRLAVVIQSHVHRYDLHACCSLMGVLCPTGIVPRQDQQAFIPIAPWTMRALIGQFDRFTSGKQLARFCAVTPRNASSGERVAAVGMVRAGDGQLKNAVIEAAQRLRRYDPRWREFSASMAARGKATSVIIGAIANRWMRWLFHQITEIPMAT